MHTNFVIEPGSEYCRKDVEPQMDYHEEEELRQAYEKPENADLVGTKLPRHVLQQLHRVDPEKINFELVAQVVRHIHTQVDPCKEGKS
ncbi:DHX57, partial [Symbiodinium necroappetens]